MNTTEPSTIPLQVSFCTDKQKVERKDTRHKERRSDRRRKPRKERDRDRDKDRSRSKDRTRDRSRDRNRDRDGEKERERRKRRERRDREREKKSKSKSKRKRRKRTPSRRNDLERTISLDSTFSSLEDQNLGAQQQLKDQQQPPKEQDEKLMDDSSVRSQNSSHNTSQSLRVTPKPLRSCMKRSLYSKDAYLKMVSFDRIYTREYKITFGDNPSCSDTMPLALDWCHSKEQQMTVDAFESTKTLYYLSESSSQEFHDIQNSCGGDTVHPNEGPAELLSRQKRYELLVRVGGYSRQEVIDAEQELLLQIEKEEQQLAEEERQGASLLSKLNNSFSNMFGLSLPREEEGCRKQKGIEQDVLYVRNPSTGEVLVVPVH